MEAIIIEDYVGEEHSEGVWVEVREGYVKAASPARLRINKCLARVQPRSEIEWLGLIPEGCRRIQIRTLPTLLCDPEFGIAGVVWVDGKEHASFVAEGNRERIVNDKGSFININLTKEFVGRQLRVKLTPKKDSPFGLYMVVD